MGILHAAVFVIRDFNTEVVVVFLFPDSRDILTFDLAVDEVFLNLITDDDVEAI